MIYLDYTANMPVEPRVLEAFCEAEGRFIGNANARHGAGREAAGVMARAVEAPGPCDLEQAVLRLPVQPLSLQ